MDSAQNTMHWTIYISLSVLYAKTMDIIFSVRMYVNLHKLQIELNASTFCRNSFYLETVLTVTARRICNVLFSKTYKWYPIHFLIIEQ